MEPKGKKKAGGEGWNAFSSDARKVDSKLPNRLQKPLTWWGRSGRFAGSKNYAETSDGNRGRQDSKAYRFAARTLDAAGYKFLQIQRGNGPHAVTGEYGGLVDHTTKKRSFAIEPGFEGGQLHGNEQKAFRDEKKSSYTNKTFPDLVAKKGDARPVAVELKVPKTYGFSPPKSALSELFEGTNPQGNQDKFFSKEFGNRKQAMGNGFEQRLLVDLNSTGLSKKDAVAYFRDQAAQNKNGFAFDTLQFIHRKKGQVQLSPAYSTADGFAKGARKETVRHDKDETAGSAASFFGSAKTKAPASSFQALAPTPSPNQATSSFSHQSQPYASPYASPFSPPAFSPPPASSSQSHSQENSQNRKRAREPSPHSPRHSSPPSQHDSPFAPPPAHRPQSPVHTGPQGPDHRFAPIPQPTAPPPHPATDTGLTSPSPAKKQRPEPPPKLDGRTKAGKQAKAAIGTRDITTMFQKKPNTGKPPGQ